MKRIYSIKGKDALDTVFKEKQSVGNGYFAIFFKQHELDHFKFALSIGKKYGNAVKRNQAKRRLRYAISKYKNVLKKNVSFVIVIKPSVSKLSYNDIQNNITKLLVKAKIIEKEDALNA